MALMQIKLKEQVAGSSVPIKIESFNSGKASIKFCGLKFRI